MEDTIVCKGHYAYMFRVDLNPTEDSKLQIDTWLELFQFSNWTGCHELGDQTLKPHYQMCVWREHKFLKKEQTKARNWWRGKTNSETHGTALTSARKIKSLTSYCRKELKNTEEGQLFSTISNLSVEQIKRIPKWQSKTAAKVQKREKLDSTVKLMSKTLTKYEFCAEFNKLYYEIYNRPCLHRNTYINYLYRAGYVTNKQIVMHVFPMEVPGDVSLNYENDNHQITNENNYSNDW